MGDVRRGAAAHRCQVETGGTHEQALSAAGDERRHVQPQLVDEAGGEVLVEGAGAAPAIALWVTDCHFGQGFKGARISAFLSLRDFCKAVYTILYTEQMAKTVPVRELRSNLSSLLDDVSNRRDHVLVTRNGAPTAALVPIDEYEALEETAEILSDPDALAALETGLAEIERDETVTLADLRSELAERRAAAG